MTERRLRTLGLAVCLVAGSIRPAWTQSAAGPGEISGVVITTSVPPTPLARVLVTVSSSILRASQTVITDDQGRFAFRGLPAGSFSLVAARSPYVKTAFGAKRPGRPGTPINLATGQRVTDVAIRLARGAVITGLVRAPGGEPAPGVQITAMPLDAQADPLAAPGVTDDRGIYRLFGLSPGRYVVRASVADRRTTGVTQISDPEMDAVLARLQQRSASGATGSSGLGSRAVVTSSRADATKGAPAFGYAPIYYPDAVDPELAETVTLAEGDERDGVDLTLQLVRNSTIEGRLVSAGGLLPTSIQVTLTRSSVRERIGGAPVTSTMARPDATGTFRFTGVLPGKYRVAARAATVTPMASGSSVNPPTDVSRPATYQLSNVLWALADITVGDDDVTGLTLTLQPGLKVTGRLVFDARSLTPPESVQLRLTEQSGASAFIPGAAGRRDGTFEIDGIPAGMYGMTSPLTETGWWLRSVVVGGRDILDFPLELGPAGDVNGVVATFTDAHTELSGSLQSTTNSPASDYFVVVFSADRAFWRPASRRIRFTRPGTDGRFALRDLPAGDYLIAALTDMEPADLTEASFVESLIPGALPVHLNDGEKKTQDLRLSR